MKCQEGISGPNNATTPKPLSSKQSDKSVPTKYILHSLVTQRDKYFQAVKYGFLYKNVLFMDFKV